MQVSAGTKEFSEAEMSELFESMGLKVQRTTQEPVETFVTRPAETPNNPVQIPDFSMNNPFSNSNDELVWGANWGQKIEREPRNITQTIDHKTEIEDATYGPDGKKLVSEYYEKAKWNYENGTI